MTESHIAGSHIAGPHIAGSQPILRPDPARVAAAQTRLAGRRAALGLPADAKAIGLSWRSGNAAFGVHKSAPLAAWAPILRQPGLVFVSVQYGDSTAELASLETETGHRIWQDAAVDPLRDMEAAAAQFATLDLVITVSNTAVHLAGGLGIPTWLLLPSPGQGLLWYWGVAGETVPFYPSLRCFRQEKPGDWQGPIAAAAANLAGFMR